MRKKEHQSRGFAALSMMLIAAAEAWSQENLSGRGKPASEQEQQADRRIIVSIPDRKLALVEDGRVVKTYPIAVGALSSPSPTGTYSIVQRIPNPTWYHPGKVVPPGKDNPLGTRWLGLSRKGYGIHGTNNPGSIGRRASHGCIRMRNADVEQLFDLVSVGEVVELHSERSPELQQFFGAPPISRPVTMAAVAGQ